MNGETADVASGVHFDPGKAFTLNHRYYVPKDDVLNGDSYVPPLTPI